MTADDRMTAQEQVEALLSRSGAQVVLALSGGAKIYAEVFRPPVGNSVLVVAWGCRRPQRIVLSSIVHANAAETSAAEYRALADRQRREFEPAGSEGADV